MEKNTDISERLQKIIDHQGVSKNEFAISLGYPRSQSVYDILKGKVKPSFDFFNKLYNTEYSAIYNISWLVTGNGNMLNEKEVTQRVTYRGDLNPKKGEKSTYSEENVQMELREPKEVYKSNNGGIEVVTVNQYGDPNIVQLDVQAQAGWARNIDNPEFYENLPSFTLPGAQWRNDTFIFIEIRGDSMHPTIYNGDWVIAKKINDFKHIREGYVHVVLTNEGVNCKRVLNRVDKRGKLVLKSDNSNYPTYQESASHIIQLYEAVCRMSYNFVNQSETLQGQINKIHAGLIDLEVKIDSIEQNKLED